MITDKDLEFIHLCNGFGGMSRDDLYIFDAILCDNDIDKNMDWIPSETLRRIAVLCRGAQFCDNNALIYDTCFDQDVDRTVFNNEVYTKLVARVCLKINDHTRKLISDIERGKRMAVILCIEFLDRICSVCGTNKRQYSCSHEKGVKYYDVLAYDILMKPDSVLSINLVNKGGVGMTQERADEIERMVFYKNLHLPVDAAPDVAYHFGRIVGRMQEALHRELAKEIEQYD